jgi:hypothetical protein
VSAGGRNNGNRSIANQLGTPGADLEGNPPEVDGRLKNSMKQRAAAGAKQLPRDIPQGRDFFRMVRGALHGVFLLSMTSS